MALSAPNPQPQALAAMVAIAVAYAFANGAAAVRLQAYFAPQLGIPPLAMGAALAALALAWLVAWRAASMALPERAALPLALAPWVLAAVAMIAWYPDLDACRVTYAGGNDRDDALDGAARSLLQGLHPYRTAYIKEACGHHLGPGGSPFSPMPGEVVLALPFVAAFGAGAWQNLAWTLAWLAAERDRLAADAWLAGLALLVLAAPQVLAGEIVVGGDVIAYGLQALVLSYLVARDKGPRWAARVVLPFLLGVALSSRPQMALVLVTLFALLRATHGPREAWRRCAIAAAGWAAVTLPFFLADPAGFDPLHVNRWIEGFAPILPQPRAWLAAVMALALAAVLWRGYATFEGFCVATGVVLVVPAVFLTGLESLAAGRLELTRFSWYAVAGFVFIASGLWRGAMGAQAAR